MANAFQHGAFQVNAFQEKIEDGVLYAIDQNDTGSFVGTVSGGIDVFDVFGKKQYKKYKALRKKLEEAEAQKRQVMLEKRLKRKQRIQELVDPDSVQRKITKVESVSEVKIDKPSIDLKKLNATIINLQRQQEKLLKTVELRNQLAQAQTLLAIHEAQMAAERDDEEALLLLI
jgi:hypothetical protein